MQNAGTHNVKKEEHNTGTSTVNKSKSQEDKGNRTQGRWELGEISNNSNTCKQGDRQTGKLEKGEQDTGKSKTKEHGETGEREQGN